MFEGISIDALAQTAAAGLPYFFFGAVIGACVAILAMRLSAAMRAAGRVPPPEGAAERIDLNDECL